MAAKILVLGALGNVGAEVVKSLQMKNLRMQAAIYLAGAVVFHPPMR
jgi:putative NADH-flavin reductase